MEADEDGVTAKNTYGGPLLLRTEFNDSDETTYQYLYNAHGDVVTLLTDGEVAATYYYDSFGNILDQTGEVSNSILYAGYQHDEETGLYYINARMYDPVTARFLQADTYAGNMDDPLSLNLYTYCLNNPHKYTDPSGHFVITAAAVLMAVRIGISVFSGVMSAKAEYDRQVAEGDNDTNWGSVLFVGAANAGISFLTFGIGQGAAAVARAGAKAVLKHIGKAVVRDAAIGALTDAGIETTRQLVTGTRITNLEYDRIAEAGVYGGIAGGASTLAGAGLEGLMKTRVAQKALAKVNLAASKGADAIQNGFAKVAKKNGKASAEAVVDGRGFVDNTLDPYALMKESGVMQTLSDAEIDAAKMIDYQMNLRQSGGFSTAKTLYHYTNEKGMTGIVGSKKLNPSLKANNPNDCFYGEGQYLSDIVPGTKSPAQLSRSFIHNPFQGEKYAYYVEIDVSDLDVVYGRDNVFVILNQEPLDLANRIVSYGKVGD